MRNKVLYGVIALIVILGLGYAAVATYKTPANKQASTTTPTPTVQQATQSSSSAAASHAVSYKGEDGKTALELLQKNYPDTQVSGTGANAFVTSINGYMADTAKHEFWKLVVNGQDAQVGAGSLVTKNSDNIVWRIDTY